jgi:hypothetical protein
MKMVVCTPAFLLTNLDLTRSTPQSTNIFDLLARRIFPGQLPLEKGEQQKNVVL